MEGVIDKGYVRGAGQGGQPGRGLCPPAIRRRVKAWGGEDGMFSLYSIISSSISSISVVEWVINMRFVLEYGFMWFSVFIFIGKRKI